ncbi:MAG: hypothetical protein FWD52_02345 [Candidatus Bathyarchaeota archaeon]|nr:hypothetical protein [Candidatus Termiticorpusculum sp.]
MPDEFRVSRRTLLLVSLLIVVLISSFFVYISLNGSSGASLENAVHVKNEEELKKAIDNAFSKGTVIALDNDIAISNELVIPSNKDVTLTSNRVTGFYKLIGAESVSTVFVDRYGVFKLDGVIVTHANHRGPELGGGVYVAEGGQLIMYSGEISGNAAVDVGAPYRPASAGGGVYNLGVFEMTGGKISDNRVSTTGSSGGGYGAGVYNRGRFTMSGGEISNNAAHVSGGGVYNSGTFTMSGGVITSNTAVDWGGGVSNDSNSFFERLDGTISDNTINGRSDNVYPDDRSNSESPGGNGGGSSNGSASGDGGGFSDGGGSGGSGGSSIGDGFSLRDVVFLCVGVAIVVVGVVVVVLFFSFQKRIEQVEEKMGVGSVYLLF